MQAAPCKSAEEALSSTKGNLIAEIKYDGERVQLHKNGTEFSFYSRSLKAVQDYKVRECEERREPLFRFPHSDSRLQVEDLKEVVKKAFPRGDKLILDSEVLMVDTKTGKPLPFGSLGGLL